MVIFVEKPVDKTGTGCGNVAEGAEKYTLKQRLVLKS